MKKISAFLLVFLLCFSIAAIFLRVSNVKATFTSYTTTFNGSVSDGYIYQDGFAYGTVRALSSGTANSAGFTLFCGQNNTGGGVEIWRAYLYFDTSSIPSQAVIDNATLSLYVDADNSDTDFNVTIQNGQPTYPHNPLVGGDYYYNWYSGAGGSRNTSDALSASAYWNITLSDDGLDWIEADTTTKLCLRSQEDIDASAPLDSEEVDFSSIEGGHAPILYVSYTVSSVTYIIHGPYLEDGTVYDGYVNVTLHDYYGVSTTYVLNGTGGTEDSETIYLDQPALYFSWNVTAYNFTRSYYLLGETYEDIYIYVPSSEEAATYYTFIVTDYYGMTNPYLQTTIIVDGTTRVVESRSLETSSYITFLFTQWHNYGLRFVCEEGTYTQDFLAETVTTNSLTILSNAFPTTNVTLGLSAWCNRTSDNDIAVYYADSKETTYWLYMEITHRNGLTDILDYSSNTTGSSQSLTWTDAEADRDYNIYLEASRSDATYTWHLTAPSLSTTSNPFDGLISAIGTWPKGFNADQIPAIIIIVACLAIFSVYSATTGIILSLIVAGILGVLGYFEMSVTNLIFAGFVAVLAHLGESKKSEREL